MSLTKRPGVGFGVMVVRNGQVLLGRRHADPTKADSELHGEGTWTIPGGKLEFGEGLEIGVVREAQEEAGIVIPPESLRLISISNDMVPDAHFLTLGFITEKFEGEPKVMEPDEITEWHWFDILKLPSPMYFPSVRVIQNYLSKTLYHPDHHR